jgi:DNA-binding GntR family transcriptional regulator
MTRIAPTALYQEVAERLRQRIFAHELTPGHLDRRAEARRTVRHFPHAAARSAQGTGLGRTGRTEAAPWLLRHRNLPPGPRRHLPADGHAGRPLRRDAGAPPSRRHRALKEIHEHLESAARDGRIDAFFEANQEFHKKIQELAGNRWLLSVIQDLRKVLKLSRLHSLSLEGRLQQSLDEHR